MIKLDDSTAISSEILARLTKFDDLFRSTFFISDLLEFAGIFDIARELDAIVRQERVAGYHFTRANPAEIKANGLYCCTVAEHRERFRREHIHRFSGSSLKRLEETWARSATEEQARIRDSKVYFTSTKVFERLGTVEYFYEYFGGEAVNMMLTRDNEIMAVLATIGRPLVVTCSLDPAVLSTYSECPFGRTLLSAYHLGINSEAEWSGENFSQREPLLPECVIEIEEIGEGRTLTLMSPPPVNRGSAAIGGSHNV